MILLLAFLGGALTIASPCILPVIPLVFARAGRSLTRETLPMLFGLAVTFTAAASVATIATGWIAVASEVGRTIALVFFAMVALTLLSSRAAEFMTRPLTRLGAWLHNRAGGRAPQPLQNVFTGFAIGLLWAPCAGPILGLIIASAALGSPQQLVPVFFTFALGAGMSLGIVLTIGERVLARLKRAGAADRVIRRTLGGLALATVAVLALGWDGTVFGRAGLVQTASAEEALIRRLTPKRAGTPDGAMSITEFGERTRIALRSAQGPMAGFSGATEWINSPALTPELLRGKVVLVYFWTFECYNCLNSLPHVKALYAKYKDRGFVVVGVHTPELPRERVVANVRNAVKRLDVEFPVVIDNDYKIWNAYHNQYWPAAYYADVEGQLRFFHFGEGKYEEQDRAVAALLTEAR